MCFRRDPDGGRRRCHRSETPTSPGQPPTGGRANQPSRWAALGVIADVRFGLGDETEQLADGSLLDQGFGQGLIALDSVAVASAVLGLEHVAGLHQVGDDAECGSLGDAEGDGDLAQADAGVAGDAQQRLRVVGQEAPRHDTDDT